MEGPINCASRSGSPR